VVGRDFLEKTFGKDPMKRLIVRLVALSLLAVLGMFAIAQAQRNSAQSDDESPVVVSRFSASGDTNDDDAPADPTARKVLGSDSRVRVIRDHDAEPAVYRGQKGAGVVPASNEVSEADDGAMVVVASGDETENTHADAPPAASAGRDYTGAARNYGSSSATSSGATAAAQDGSQDPRPSSIREATDAIDAAVKATISRDGLDATSEPSSENTSAPKYGNSRTYGSENTAPRNPVPRTFVPQPATPEAAQTPVATPVRPSAISANLVDAPVAAPARNIAAQEIPAQSTGAQGTGTPGSQDLEGAQTPGLTIEKVVPPEVQVGKTATFEIRIQNTSRSVARELQIIDQVPQGTRLVNTEPRADLGDRGELVWNLAALAPGATAVVRVELVPMIEGQIGSVARVRFAADASARTTVTKPQLTIEVVGDEQVMTGDDTVLAITVANPGSGEATDVILEADIPANLKHPAGTELEFEVGTLRPNESRRLELTMTGIKQGPASPTLIVRAAGVPAVEQAKQLEVVAPKLEVGIEGPKRRFLDRKSTHVVTVSNPGTAAATDVEVVAYLPSGMKFVEANNHGTYDARQHAVYWSLAELPAQRSGDVQLVTLPTESGDQVIKVEGKAERGLADAHTETISVEGVAALSFQISDLNDPLAIGGQAAYEVRVVNTGTKSASNVQVVAVLPAEMAAIDAKGPTSSALREGKIVFEPISRLAPKEQQVFQFRAEATKAGDLRIRVQLTSEEIRTPITQEESTRVFAD
jgi:uncharacterized repeat protein (TIGR01451 family)